MITIGDTSTNDAACDKQYFYAAYDGTRNTGYKIQNVSKLIPLKDH